MISDDIESGIIVIFLTLLPWLVKSMVRIYLYFFREVHYASTDLESYTDEAGNHNSIKGMASCLHDLILGRKIMESEQLNDPKVELPLVFFGFWFAAGVFAWARWDPLFMLFAGLVLSPSLMAYFKFSKYDYKRDLAKSNTLEIWELLDRLKILSINVHQYDWVEEYHDGETDSRITYNRSVPDGDIRSELFTANIFQEEDWDDKGRPMFK